MADARFGRSLGRPVIEIRVGAARAAPTFVSAIDTFPGVEYGQIWVRNPEQQGAQVRGVPMLLRPPRRRAVRRFVFLCALIGVLLVAPSAGGVPGPGERPDIRPIYYGTLGADGWYRSNVTLNWVIETDPSTPILNSSPDCNARTFRDDTQGVTVKCWAENAGGRSEITTKVIKIDKTVPAVTPAIERGADANGWYNRPLTVSFTGADGTSGISNCTSARYAGPDTPAAVVSGTCSDGAGNVTTASFSFKYDGTAPTLFAVATKPGNRKAQVTWRKSSDTSVVQVIRVPGRRGQGESVVYRGSATGFTDTGLIAGRKYQYRVIASDAAANTAERTVNIIGTGALLGPLPGARVAAPPMLVWAAAKNATYYNVQLIRNGRKVLSAWPVRPSYRLRRTWSYHGRRFRLRPGTYRWYVWPGFGKIAAGRYGRQPLGSSTFVVAK